MKKKNTFGKIIKRTLLIVLVVCITTVGLVFCFDKYAAAKYGFDNKYDDAYWNKEKLDGFTYSSDLRKNTNKFNLESDEYVSPITDGMGDKEKIEASRYKEELLKQTGQIKKDYNNKVKEAANLLNKVWNGTMEDWANEYLTSSFADAVITGVGYEAIKALGFTGTKEAYFTVIASKKFNMVDVLAKDGYTGDDAQLAKAVVNDPDSVKVVTKLNTTDQAAYDKLQEEISNLEVTVKLADDRYEELKEWDEYYKTDLLGFGGLATDYPNKPVISVATEDDGTLELWFNSYLTTFKIVEKDADGQVTQEWSSNPEEIDPKATSEVKIIEKSLLSISYSILNGKTDTYSTYEYSVSDMNDVTKEKLTPQYAIKFDPENNSIMVWYKLKKRGLDYTYFPKYFSQERLDELLARSADRAANNVTVTDPENIAYGITAKDLNTAKDKTNRSLLATLTQSYYKKIELDSVDNEFGFVYYEYVGKIENMSGLVRNNLKEWLYGWCGYTLEEVQEDNMMFGYEVSNINPEYSLAIEYTLTENGLEVNIPGNSIKEDPNFPVTSIDILPYFTATKAGVEGYTVIPDGSGAVMEHDNNKTNFAKYRKRVYTTDLTEINEVNQGTLSDLMFPMYAVINNGNNSGMLTYATSAAAQLELTADVSGREDSYNKNFFTAYLRESKIVTIGSSIYAKDLVKWTTNKTTNDIVLNYRVLKQDELSYSKAAKIYRDILVDTYGIEATDTTDTPTLDMDVLGTYSFTDNFIGIPYERKDSLTTLDQLEQIIKEYQSIGVKHINAFYEGWTDSALLDKSFKGIKVSGLIGSKKKFQQALDNYNQSTEVNIYPTVGFTQFNEYSESFGTNHYTTRGVDGEKVVTYPYDLATNLADKKANPIYTVSPRFYEEFAKSLAKNYTKVTKTTSVAINGLGSQLSGDYKKNIETFKSEAVKAQLESFKHINNGGIKNIALDTPYDYAFKYTSIARNIPYTATQYEIFDYSIPFYQLVANGVFDYAGESINENSEKGITEHLMRMIETGSNMSFIFSYDSSEKLLQTPYNMYYYSLYTNWIDDVKSLYTTLEDLNIYAGEFVSHEQVDNNVFKVTYNVNNEDIVIYLNYTVNDYTAPDGTEIPAKYFAKAL